MIAVQIALLAEILLLFAGFFFLLIKAVECFSAWLEIWARPPAKGESECIEGLISVEPVIPITDPGLKKYETLQERYARNWDVIVRSTGTPKINMIRTKIPPSLPYTELTDLWDGEGA